MCFIKYILGVIVNVCSDIKGLGICFLFYVLCVALILALFWLILFSFKFNLCINYICIVL